jgi:E3 ubiquitin-protein ligase MARCH1/8
MASTISHSDSQAKLTENEILIDESTMNDDDDEEEEATVPKSDDQTLITTPFLPNKESSIPRQLSLLSSSSKTSDYPDICRICHCEGTNDEPLISPCLCLGTMQYLHQSCLQRWIKSAGVKSCELCKFEFIMHSEIKPFKQWQKLDMNVVERRKIMCSVAFNLIAVTCVLWSLYVLIEKTRDEVKTGKLQWPFWTKLIVVAIGFTGGLIFLYVQCKMYLQLCIRWRQFNQRIVIHSISEQRPDEILSSGIKNPNNNNNNGNCIITVLDANDLPPLNSNTSLDVLSANNSNNRNRRYENTNPNRNVLHRFLIFHRSDQSQT